MFNIHIVRETWYDACEPKDKWYELCNAYGIEKSDDWLKYMFDKNMI